MVTPATTEETHTTIQPRQTQLLREACTIPSKLLGWLRESNDLLHSDRALRERLTEEGYLLLRGVIPREMVLASRRELLEKLSRDGQLAPGTELMDAIANPAPVKGVSPHRADMSAGAAFRRVVEGPEVMGLFARLFGEDVLTFDEKWLRITKPGAFTGAHCDAVYMGRGTPRLLTCWIPHGDVPIEHGPVVLLPGSHRHPSFEQIRATYGRSDNDRDNFNGWFSNDPVELCARSGGELRWASTDFAVGDLVCFGMQLMHGSLANVSDRIRLSSDTRYQPRSEPADPRWTGPRLGHVAKPQPRAIEDLRKEWGV